MIELHRVFSNDALTCGILLVEGSLQCWTLEDPAQIIKIPGRTRIPAGTYPIGLRTSARYEAIYGHPMLHILDVPNFEYIYIHPGNTTEDTSGCILVGNGLVMTEQGSVELASSRRAYLTLYEEVIPMVRKGKASLTIFDETFSLRSFPVA